MVSGAVLAGGVSEFPSISSFILLLILSRGNIKPDDGQFASLEFSLSVSGEMDCCSLSFLMSDIRCSGAIATEGTGYSARPTERRHSIESN